MSIRALTVDDDNLHKPTSNDPYWTETAWFAFSIPSRKMTGFFYPVFRTNMNICAAGVYLWDASGEADHTILYSHNYWHLPIPADITQMRLSSGLSYDVLEPLKKYRVSYESKNYKADLVYTGLFEPKLNDTEDHLDQFCHVVGNINFRGEEIPVDCYEIRDKSWHVRSDAPLDLPENIKQGCYSYAINKDSGFLIKAFGPDKDNLSLGEGAGIGKGLYWKDGHFGTVVSGTRRVERKSGRPATRVFITATDELGRSFEAVGETFNHFAHRSTPSIWAWISGTTWTFNGEKCFGEDQEWTAGINA